MSLSQQPGSYSSSPSKSSQRRTSSNQRHSLLPSPHFEGDNPTHDPGSPRFEQAIIDASQEQQDPQTRFQPFFALIEDTITNEHYHPTVHYIFADDDTEIITEAACRSLAQDLDPAVPSEEQDLGGGPEQTSEDTLGALLPASKVGVREHYLVLDIHPTTTNNQEDATTDSQLPFEVSHAQSFSSEWQILRSNLTNAPTIGGEGTDSDEGLMLRIEGRRNTPSDTQTTHQGDGDGKMSMEEQIALFQTRLNEIRLLIPNAE